MRCQACDELCHPAPHRPHAGLTLERATWHPQGFLEQYRCMECHARWNWLIARDGQVPLKVVASDAVTMKSPDLDFATPTAA